MSESHQPSPNELAVLVALLIQRYTAHRGKQVTRFRLARRTLRKMAGRPKLRDQFVDKWLDVMALEHGWLVYAGAEEFLLIKSGAAKGWTKIAAKRVDDLVKRLNEGDLTAIDDAKKELIPHVEPVANKPALEDGEEAEVEADEEVEGTEEEAAE